MACARAGLREIASAAASAAARPLKGAAPGATPGAPLVLQPQLRELAMSEAKLARWRDDSARRARRAVAVW